MSWQLLLSVMYKQALAKIFFVIAVSLFIAKPFLGFSLFSRSHPPAIENIFIKAFTKRKVELNEDSKTGLTAIQKKLAEPLPAFSFAPFFLFLALPLVYRQKASTINSFLRRARLNLLPAHNPYLLNNSFLI